MDMDFFPTEDYTPSETSNYTKFPVGEVKVRALSSSIVGFEYFTKDNKVVRSKDPFEDTPDIKTGESPKEFWAFVVWNYTAKKIQIMEVNKKSMMEQMMNYIKNEDWGSPKNYDVTIKRVGTSKNDTKYTVIPSPSKPVDAAILAKFMAMKIDLNALYVGADPFLVDR